MGIAQRIWSTSWTSWTSWTSEQFWTKEVTIFGSLHDMTLAPGLNICSQFKANWRGEVLQSPHRELWCEVRSASLRSVGSGRFGLEFLGFSGAVTLQQVQLAFPEPSGRCPSKSMARAQLSQTSPGLAVPGTVFLPRQGAKITHCHCYYANITDI